MKPKISIIIPAYNREKVISKTLEAILSQTFEDWECLVVDDHSKDATRESIMQFVAKDSRFVFLENERTKGACGARNTGLQHLLFSLPVDDYKFKLLFLLPVNDLG